MKSHFNMLKRIDPVTSSYRKPVSVLNLESRVQSCYILINHNLTKKSELFKGFLHFTFL
jgi:hypothetical protein